MENKQTFFKKFSLNANGRIFGFGTSPEADWKIIFISTVVLVTTVIVLSIFIFIKIDKGEIFVIERLPDQGEKILNLSLLKETVSYYQNKAIEFERIKNSASPSADPSL
jgi:hypothetical protein